MTRSRTRIRFSKHGKVRFTSHRDVARIWERSLRRAGVPVVYSAGFSPRPKIAFGLALPTGYSSDAEYLDVEIDPVWIDGIDNETLVGALTASLPTGMTALAASGIASGEPSLQHAVTSCTWRIDAAGADAREATDAVSRAMDGSELLAQRERKGRLTIDNIRPAVHAVEVQGNITDGVRLIAELATQPRAARPADLLASLHPPLSLVRACRLHQWIATDACERREPLAVAELSVAGAGAEP
ncbi:MAG: TIGR03936 family radical SAM-associated protein [Acidimicrobiaceae bacterium]|nr:TIGR03936 family radical SAM-associated protein [Acidimicrobiaceae bacterium]